MKRKDLIKKFESNGWWLKRHGSKHDVYTNGKATDFVSRQIEINEDLAKEIIKRNGLQ